MTDKPKYANIDEFLDSREPSWKDLGLSEAKASGDEWLNRTHSEDDGLLDELAGESHHTQVPPTSKGAALTNRLIEKESASPRLGANRIAQTSTSGGGTEDNSLLNEITESLEEAEKGGKVEKKNLSDGEIKRYIHGLLNQGAPPAKVAANLKKLAEIELVNHQMGTRYLQDNAGLLGMSYLEPNTFLDKTNPNYGRKSAANGVPSGVRADRNCDCGAESRESQLQRRVPESAIKDKKAFNFNSISEQKQLEGVGGVVSQIRPGDRVTIRTPHGQELTGKAVMYNAKQQCWVLNLGGKHGTPGVATDENIVNVKKVHRASVKIKTALKIETRTNSNSPDPLKEIVDLLNVRFNEVKALNPEGYLDSFEQSLLQHMLAVGEKLGLKVTEEPGDKWVFADKDGAMHTGPSPFDEEEEVEVGHTASGADCVRQAKAWKSAGIQVRAKSVKQITACADCSYFKKNGSSKSCGLYGLPVVSNAKELTSIVNRLTAGVPAESKRAALVQIANRLPEQNIPKAASVEAPFIRQASFTKEREYGFKEAEHFSGAKVQKLHAAGHTLKVICAAADKKYGALETSKAVREFIASLSTDKGKIIMASADADFLKKIGIHNEAIVGAAKCASCKAHSGKETHKAASTEMVTRAPETFVQATPGGLRSTRHTAAAHFDSAAVAKYHTAGHSVEKIFKVASAKYGSAQASKAVRDWAQNLKNTNTKIALSQIDCTTLNKMGVKLSAKNAILGAEKCGSC